MKLLSQINSRKMLTSCRAFTSIFSRAIKPTLKYRCLHYSRFSTDKDKHNASNLKTDASNLNISSEGASKLDELKTSKLDELKSSKQQDLNANTNASGSKEQKVNGNGNGEKESVESNNPLKEEEIEFNEEEQKQINAYETDQIWNLVHDLKPDYNPQKALIVAKKQFQRTKQELTASILFEDLLKSEIDILIYNSDGKPFLFQLTKLAYLFATIAASLWAIWHFTTSDPKSKVLLEKTTIGKVVKVSVYICCGYLLLTKGLGYARFQRRYVEKVIYNTQKQQFTFVMRKFFGQKYNHEVSRFKIIYTENKMLNSKGTNYFNLSNRKQYSLTFKPAWKKQDLFSHLISQRIKI